MFSTTTALPNDVDKLKEIISEIESKYKGEIDLLREQVRYLKGKLFGKKSEKLEIDAEQISLFDEAEISASDTKPVSKEDVQNVSGYSRKKSGRKPLPADIPRVEVIHDLQPEEKVCACGSEMSRIGEDVSEKLEIIPAKLQVIKNIRYKYTCKSCEGIEGEGPTVKIAPSPVQLIPKSIATPSLISHIITSKYVDALPLYRQEKIFSRLGIDLCRANMANWIIQVADKCKPLINLLHQELLSGPLINIDETPVQVLKEPGRKNTTRSYMWVFRGGPPDTPVSLYLYKPTRSGSFLQEYLKGFKGYVQTDGYIGYDYLQTIDGITLLGCWAHARRKFKEVINVVKKNSVNPKKVNADSALEYIQVLYGIEHEAKEKNLSFEDIFTLRQKESKPILKELKTFLEKIYPQTPPKGLLGKAISYTLNQWNRLEGYTEAGYLRPDNNLAENAIRPFVVGRKNWLFSGHPNGAEASACMYSLIETAKANKLEPYQYLKFLFEKLPFAETQEDYKRLLPQHAEQEDSSANKIAA